MLSELTDPSAVERALTEFDEAGRDQFLRRYGYRRALRYFVRVDGKEYDSKAIAGVAYGYQFPERGPLVPSQFSAGESTVRPTLERLGFEVVDRHAEVLASDASLSELFEVVCDLLHQRESGTDDFAPEDLNIRVQKSIPTRLVRIGLGDVTIRGRTGMGTASDVPWVGIFPSGAETSAQRGYYLVYLFAKDGSAVFLSLNQGTEGVKGGLDVFQKRAIDLRRASGDNPNLILGVDLRSTNQRPKRYEAGSALALRYERGQVPPDGVLEEDLRRMLRLLDAVDQTGLTWDPDVEPLHVVFKWNADIEPRTVDIHKEIAERQGSVWWGRFSRSPQPSIAQSRLDQLQKQIATSRPTHAYLYRRGALWRTSVTEATVDPPSSDDPRFPAYYKPSDCNLFLRLTDFVELQPDWLQANTVLASQPDSDPGRLGAALGNQTTPLFVYELGGISDVSARPIPADEADDEVDQSDLTLADVCEEIVVRLRDAGLDFGTRHDSFVRSAVVALATKRFLLLTGLSGSGKTRLGIAIGQWFGESQLAVVPVRPDWTGPESVFGFENGLSEVVDGRHAWTMTAPLEFMLQAARDPGRPYLLLLDEMNLAHVERYFADVLSGMESESDILPNLRRMGDDWRLDEPRMLPFPKNLFVVGTVNIDETTYMFSPKVLDRANTLEFRVLSSDLRVGTAPITQVEPGSPSLVRRFMHAATTVSEDDWEGRSQLAGWFQELHALLHEYDREFGHRVFFEALRFGALLSESGESDPVTALDLQVLQKVLPRIHGSIRQVSDPLTALAAWCWSGPGRDSPAAATFDALAPPQGEAVLKLSFEKIARMTRRLRANHFVSFAE